MQGPHVAAKCWPGLAFNAPVDAQHFAGLLLAASTHQKKSDYYEFRADHHSLLNGPSILEREEQWKGSERSNTNIQKHRLHSTQETAVGARKGDGHEHSCAPSPPHEERGRSQQVQNKQ